MQTGLGMNPLESKTATFGEGISDGISSEGIDADLQLSKRI
jgi:hypothetical protein